MRGWLLGLMMAGLWTAPALAQPRERPAAASYVVGCDRGSEADQQWCRQSLQQFLAEYPKAFEGDYQAQRNLAYLLAGSTRPMAVNPLRPSPSLSCAWRVVILETGGPRITDLDFDLFRQACRAVPEHDKRGAFNEAERLLREIPRISSVEAPQDEAKWYLSALCDRSANACGISYMMFVELYKKAKAGDRLAQQAVALNLLRGDAPPMLRSPIHACAWFMVAARNPANSRQVRDREIEQRGEQVCGALDQEQLRVSTVRADVIRRELLGRLAVLPPRPQRRQVQDLPAHCQAIWARNSEARPLGSPLRPMEPLPDECRL